MSQRNEDPKEIETVGQNLPAFMQDMFEAEDIGFEAVEEYISLPNLKIIQKTTDESLGEVHGVGSVVLVPGPTPVSTKSTSFTAIPVHFHTEFCKWSDLKDTESPSIVERSFDPTSDIAKKARDKDLRIETYDGNDQMSYRYVEHLNFAMVITSEDGSVDSCPTMVSFCKGEFGTGKSLLNAMYQRKLRGKRIPMFLQRWEFKTSFRDLGPERKWWGLDYTLADDSIVLDPETAKSIHASHLELKSAFAEKKFRVNHDEADQDNSAETSADVKVEL